jgi:superfamily II DNA or RNA helicase
MAHTDLFITDNANEERTVKKYLKEWCPISRQMDVATGYLEIGGLLELDSDWQKLDKIRIILGNEMTKRTKEVIDTVADYMLNTFKNSMAEEQEKNDFLVGVPAILDAMKNGKIECRVFDSSKFHAKAYITYFRQENLSEYLGPMNLPSGYALVGSSNFTKAGLTKNIELNVQIKDNIEELQEWYEERWNEAQDITEAVLKVIENHCKEYSPYDVYLRSMYELFKGREETVSEWENNDSVIYQYLSQYQRDGYNSLVGIADRYSGAFLCDGVGLGKTFVGMMLIERFVMKERKNVVLIVPAAARYSVWETTIKKFIPDILEGFYSFKIINHTDLLLEKNENLMNQIANQAEVVVIDEAHHFRNRSSNRYRKLFEMMGTGPKKKMFMLTATPINNSFLDLQHLIELFTQRQEDYFKEAPLGIHSLSGHFRTMEKKLAALTGIQSQADISDATDATDDIFRADNLVNQLVVQRSRAYVKQSLSEEEGDRVQFSIRKDPMVADYDLRASYGPLIDDFIKSFYRKDKKTGRIKPILALAVYSPYEDIYYKGDPAKLDEMATGRQAQVVNLIRQLLLKRFESSIAAFEETCIRIYWRLKKFLDDYHDQNPRAVDRLFDMEADVIEYAKKYVIESMQSSIEELEDDLPEYVWFDEENELNEEDFDIRAMIDDTILDMEVLASFIEDMMGFDPKNDDKLRELKDILSNAPEIQGKKVIVFSEYRATAKYLFDELKKAGFKNLYEIDGQTKGDRHAIITRFSPYYNDSSSAEIEDEINILIATDVLAEGLNLQDATCLINYELHWNPVRLMQRIGRVDRRRSIDVEEHLLKDHPEMKADRAYAYYWNFLPPDELDKLLALYKTVSRKTLAISKTFGIEGKKLLTPEDDFEALKDFNTQYEGETSADEKLALAYQELMQDNPDYEEIVKDLPKKMYSGKNADEKGTGYFFCYELPTKKADGSWSDGDGLYRWYLIKDGSKDVIENTYEIWQYVKCEKEEPRTYSSKEDFIEARKTMDKYITKSYMRTVQAPLNVKPRLVTWMRFE